MVISSLSADTNADWAGVEWLMYNGLTLGTGHLCEGHWAMGIGQGVGVEWHIGWWIYA